MNLATGQFGNATVAFAFPGQKIPADLAVEFELLRITEKEPAMLRDWVARLERSLARAAQPHPWSILRVRPGMERRIAAWLEDHRVRAYVPLERYRPRGRPHARVRPIMPQYVFVLLRTEADLDLARGDGEREIMCRQTADGPKPVAIPAQTIGELAFLEAFRAFDTAKEVRPTRRGGRRARPLRNWQHGQRVRIADGPLAGFIGEIMRAERADRMELVVDMFGRLTEVVLDEAMLEGSDEP